ncbi:hypothetical protein N7523_007653 [Penicillium sp. IBT 18751x]|nr:hypothetical protein N7523_007653 [Penicillium sp. IBT 18751x]
MLTCLASRYARSNVWAYDSAADTYVCNDRSQFVTFTPYEGDLLVGDTKASIEGKGLVYLRFENTTFDLYETLYVPRFHLNILSAKRAKRGGVYHNQRLNRLEKEDGTPICKTSDDTGITLILGHKNEPMQKGSGSPGSPSLHLQTAFNTTTKPIQPIKGESDPENDTYEPKDEPMTFVLSYSPPILKGSDSLWHQRLGHPSIDASLPEYLWPEAVQAAVYVLNRTPNKQLGWKTPYQALFNNLDPKPGYMKPKPDLSNLRVYGCKAFVRINNIPRLAKMKPRAMIGYLVGFKASNIWRIWVPKAHKVINARDCVFDEASFYRPNSGYDVIDDQSKEAIQPLSTPEFNLVITETSIEEPLDDPLTIRPLPDESELSSDDDTEENEENDREDQILGDLLPSPEESEGEEEPHPEVGNASLPSESSGPSLLSQITIPAEDLTPDARVPDQSPDFMVLIDNSSYDEEMMNQYDHPKRDRSPSPDSSNKRQAFASFYNAFSAAIKDQPKKVHQDNLPPPPESWGEMLNHPYKAEFMQAADVEYQKLKKMNTWTPVKRKTIEEDHKTCKWSTKPHRCPRHQILPLRWVFTYKVDENGYLAKFKARICVRGDL